MSWSRVLEITSCMWFLYVSQFTRDLITSSFHPKILYSSASSSSSPLWALFCIVVTTSSPLYQLSHQSALAFFGVEVLRIVCKPNKQFTLILGSPEKTTCRPTFFWIWWWWSKKSILTLYKRKPLEEEPQVKCWRDGWLNAAKPDSWNVNISFYQAILAAELHCAVLR